MKNWIYLVTLCCIDSGCSLIMIPVAITNVCFSLGGLGVAGTLSFAHETNSAPDFQLNDVYLRLGVFIC